MQKLAKNERVVCAYAQRDRGLGRINEPIWVVIQDGEGKLRRERLDPDDQTPEMAVLYQVSAAAHGSMTAAVHRKLT